MLLEEEVGGRAASYARSLNEIEGATTTMEGAASKEIPKNVEVNPNVQIALQE
jgi:hypothetical protein